MKKLFISLALFSILYSEAQQVFEGGWSMEDSSYTTVIIASDYEVLKILNYSFEADATLNEVILSQTDSTLTTSIYNKRNGYTIGLSYTIIDENTLQCIITGDENSTVQLNKIQNPELQ